MNKRSKPIIIVSCILAVGALLAYCMPAPKEPVPSRILLQNSGGRVVFTHAAHTQYPDMTCQTCHHELKIPERELADKADIDPSQVFKCGACHISAEDTTFKEAHQKLYAKNDGGKTCLTCHHTEDFSALNLTDTSPAPTAKDHEFQPCADCHSTLARMDAFHKQCFDCHDSRGKGPGIKAPCAQCHIK